jgi:hypothetical protein
MNKGALVISLVLGSLVVLGAIALVVVFFATQTVAPKEDDITYLDEEALRYLAKQNDAVKPSTPPAPQPQQATTDSPARPEVKPVEFKAKLPEIPPVFEVPPPAPQPMVAAIDPKQIDAAIDKGVVYLKRHQNLNGTWGAGAVHAVGYASLPGLTLLECGVSPKDPVVQKAAAFVRNNIPRLTKTYELSLAILFLDRLGEPRDEGLIRTMALRLVAGQTAAGGWNYDVPILPSADMDKLFAFLQRARTATSMPITSTKGSPNPLTGGMDIKTSDPLPTGQDPKRAGGNPAVRSGGSLPDIPARKSDGKQMSLGASLPFDPDGKKPAAKDQVVKSTDQVPATPPKKATPKASPKNTPLRPDFLPAHLQNIPAVANHGKAKGKAQLKPGRDDNSNSQFAMLALWAARRHGVPTDATLLLAYQRYFTSQSAEGGWSYMPNKGGQTPSMTCVGLLGLAMGHGSAPDVTVNKGPKVAGANTNEDPAIQSGLKALGNYIGRPAPAHIKPPMENLYFLWSVERVAMLYSLKTIGGKDWYAWGARILIPNQLAEGSWQSSYYHGSAPTIDTCFALLFLKRSNLVQDLTDNLQLFMAIQDPDARRE